MELSVQNLMPLKKHEIFGKDLILLMNLKSQIIIRNFNILMDYLDSSIKKISKFQNGKNKEH
jgi:uncharacterized membrane protein